MKAKEAMREVVRKHPLLCNYGYGLGDEALKWPMEQRKILFDKQQKELLENLVQFERACRWWNAKEKTKTFKDQRYDSYALKHMAESEIGYVTNGAFIAAAIHCGFKVRATGWGPNVLFNLSQRGIHDTKL